MGGVFSSFLSCESICSILSFVSGEAKYIWDLEGNLGALQSEFDKLIQTRDDLHNEVRVAEQQPRKERTSRVKGWLQSVEQMESKVGELQNAGNQEIDRLCLGGFCSSDLISSYNFGKRVVKLKQEVIKLKDGRVDIREVAEIVPDDASVQLAVEQTVIGQDSIFDQVWRCITEKENRVGIIGLYGKGGVGKTTLLKQVNNRFRDQQHHFDVVIWVVVSSEPKLGKIQDDIGERIGLSGETWNRRSVERKASDISNILSQKKFVLLLDDIWNPIDLTEVGVPLQSLNIASKIVFTTRSLDVCGKMKVGKQIEVRCLGDEEAWKLFQEEVGRYALDSRPGILELAKTLARECHGLPLALKTVARAMASLKNPEEWERAIKILSTSASTFSDMEEKVFARLKFSYDHLSRDALRSCLLYCCLFPEDYEIPKEVLINYGISEGFLDDLGDGYTAIGDLLRACLLEEGEDDSVKMHDLIRDMASWIACKIEKENENFLVRTRGQGAPKIEDWEGVKRVSLIQNDIKSLSEIPNCPRLQTLLLDSTYRLGIDDGFFQSTPSLRVLSLRKTYYETDLLTSGISSLVLLHHLDLSWTFIRELPQELKALVDLRYLNLEMTRFLSKIPKQLISSFSKLQVYRMRDGGDWKTAKTDSVLSEYAVPLMNELICLENLNLITLTLRSSHAVQFFFESPKLVSITQHLNISYCESTSLNVSTTMENLKEISILMSDIQDMKIETLQSGFHRLCKVFIISCYGVKDLTCLAFAPNLKFIKIEERPDVEEIISVEKLSGVSEIMAERNLFAQLETLNVWELHNLKSICRDPLPFPQLKNIVVYRCQKLKKLPLKSSGAKDCKVIIKGETEWWEELQWEDQATQNAFSTCFVSYEDEDEDY